MNLALSKLSRPHNWKLINHSNITQKHLNRSGLRQYLNRDGTPQSARNFLYVINYNIAEWESIISVLPNDNDKIEDRP